MMFVRASSDEPVTGSLLSYRACSSYFPVMPSLLSSKLLSETRSALLHSRAASLDEEGAQLPDEGRAEAYRKGQDG